MGWDGSERRQGGNRDHDLLTKIDANLSNHMSRVEQHFKDDANSFEKSDKAFEKHNSRLTRLEMWGAMVAGGLAVLQVLLSVYRGH